MARVHHSSVGGLEVITIVSGAPWNQNCYLISERASGAFIVVDPGFDSPELRDAIRAAGTRPAHVLLTHGHPDHLGAAADLSEMLDVDCRLGRADARVARQAPAYAAAFAGLRIRSPKRIVFVEPETSLQFGGTGIRTLALPGHTPGSLGFVLGNAALTGDTLFREHVGRTDLPGGDSAAMTESIDRLILNTGPMTQLFAGHGRPWTAGEARDWWVVTGQSRGTVTSS